MKMLSGFLSMLMLIGIGGLFILKSPSGESWLSMDSFMPSLPEAKTVFQDKLSSGLRQTKKLAGSSGKDVVYRWQDEQGTWQFSDTPPKNQSNLETVMVQPDRNLIQGLAQPAEETKSVETEPRAASFPLPTTIPLSDIPQLIEDARSVKKLLDKRYLAEGSEQEK